MRAKHTKWLAGLLVFIMSLSVVVPVFAANPLDVEVPITVVETGSVASGMLYDVVLTANDSTYPLPVGAESGKYVMSVEAGSYMIPINYTEVGLYYYTIHQEAGDDPLAVYDPRVYDMTVFISFKDDGSLESAVVMQVKGEEGKPDEAEFVNHWTPVGSWAPLVSKTLLGRNMLAGEFSFTLEDSSGVLQTVKNDADGKVVFDEITFHEAGVYEYVLSEVKGKAYAVNYDEIVQDIDLIVKDNGDGTLSFDPSYDEKGVVFENTFLIPKIDVTATKKWVSGPEDKPMIQLQLYRDDKALGEVVELEDVTTYTWKNLDKTDAEGKEYTYTVKETVVPNNYKVSYSEDGLTVTNTWIKAELPTTGKTELPKTGMGSSIPILITGIALLVVTLYLGLKHRNGD